MTVVMPPMPDIKEFMHKKIKVLINEERVVKGILIGFDHFMNLSIKNATIEIPNKTPSKVDNMLIRGSCIESFTESIE